MSSLGNVLFSSLDAESGKYFLWFELIHTSKESARRMIEAHRRLFAAYRRYANTNNSARRLRKKQMMRAEIDAEIQ
jgi:hypothetical protein